MNIKHGMDLIFDAAMSENSLAQYYIEICCFNGVIMKKNVQEGVAWLKIASSNGNTNAKLFLKSTTK